MPGILGLTAAPEFPANALSASLERMASPLRYNSAQSLQSRVQQGLAAGAVDLGTGFGFQKSGIAERDGVTVVIDGEVFPNAGEVPAELHQGAATIQRAEYCLHCYLAAGPQFIDQLNGVFAVAVLDSRDRSLHIGTDRFGHRLLFYWAENERCAFASSLRSLLLLNESVGRRYDERALAELIVFERILGDRTLFPDIKRLPAGCRATWRGRDWEVTRYFSPTHSQPPAGLQSWQDGAAELQRRLRRSLEKRLADGAKAGLFLSGGLDSRLVLGCADRQVISATFSHPQRMPREAAIASRLAKAAGSPLLLLERDIDYYARIAPRAAEINEGMATYVGSHSPGVHRQLAEAGIRVLLTGDRSDVAFKDYFAGSIDTGGLEPWTGSRLQVRRAARKLMSSGIIRKAEHQDLMMLSFSPSMKSVAAGVWEQTLEWLETLFRPGVPLEDTLSEMAVSDWQGFTALGMMRGTATEFCERTPFFDNDVWELSLQLPVSWRADARIVRKAISIASPRLARIPDVSNGIPPAVSPGLSRIWSRTRDFARRTGSKWGRPSQSARRSSSADIFKWSGFHDRDLALKHCEAYRRRVIRAVESLPGQFFDTAMIRTLLDDDLAADNPQLSKLFEILITFSEFALKWGTAARREHDLEPSPLNGPVEPVS
jgi:asparagine synthetase B (glutamine-hydrolysing)